MSRWVLVGVVAVIACGAPPRVHKPGDEYLAAIQIEGNHAIASDTLTAGLVQYRHEGHGIDDYQLALDTTRIAGAYQRLGYFAVDVRSRVERHGDAATVIYTIVEGKRATGRVEIVGLPPDVSAAKARALVNLADGAPFDYDAFDSAKAPLLQLVEDAGYARAQLDASVIADRKHLQATIELVIDAGPRCKFGNIEISGIEGDLATAVRARIAFKPGDPYSTAAINDTQHALYGLGRFSVARVEPVLTGTAVEIPVKIAVAEGNRHEARAGGGFGLDPLTLQLRLRGQYSIAGFPGPMWTTNFDLKPAIAYLRENCDLLEFWQCPYEPRVRAVGTLTRQDLVFTDVQGQIEGGADYLTLEAYTLAGARARLGLSSPLWTRRVQGRLGWQLADYTFSHPMVDDFTQQRLGLLGNERIGTFSEVLVIDLRDQPIEPRYGAYAELRIAEGTKWAGSAFDYVQLTPELRGFVPVGFAQLAMRLRVGAIYGDIPVTERYFSGGASSNRGFDERQLSPVAPNLDPTMGEVVIGGAGLIETGMDLRAKLGELKGFDIGGVAFVDGGDVTETPSQLDPWHLHWAVGTGIRMFLLPVLPIGFDIAYRLNRYGPGEPEAGQRFHYFLSVGEAF